MKTKVAFNPFQYTAEDSWQNSLVLRQFQAPYQINQAYIKLTEGKQTAWDLSIYRDYRRRWILFSRRTEICSEPDSYKR